jgi:hypothetical protein
MLNELISEEVRNVCPYAQNIIVFRFTIRDIIFLRRDIIFTTRDINCLCQGWQRYGEGRVYEIPMFQAIEKRDVFFGENVFTFRI